MSSEQSSPPRPSLAAIKQALASGTLTEISYPRLELKSQWKTDHGKSISAIANHESLTGGWLIVGVDDKGKLAGKDEGWCKKNYERIGNQINEFLNPMQAVKEIYTESFGSVYCIMLEIKNPDYVTYWAERAYKRAGSSIAEMKAGEHAALAMRLPGDDYSALTWQGEVNSALVLDFARKVVEKGSSDFPQDLSELSSSQILRQMRLDGRMAAGILFGDVPVRIAHYDADDQVDSNVQQKGLYNILSDSFINHIQAASERKGATIEGNSTSLKEYRPYPPKLLREILANAVAHSFYQRYHGEIIVDIHLDRVTVRNNASLDAKGFAKEWYSKRTMAKNKLLMEVLRTAGITDELGTGKANVFRLAMEAGKEEPIIEFNEEGNFGKWQITVRNGQLHPHIGNLLHKLSNAQLPTPLHERIATALVLWKDRKWSEIRTRLDDYHKKIADEVVEHDNAPVIIIDDDLFVLRWAEAALKGQSSIGFTPVEEEMLMRMLVDFTRESAGQFSTQDVKKIIGLGKSASESVQLSNLFRKWQRLGRVEKVKQGTWRFLS